MLYSILGFCLSVWLVRLAVLGLSRSTMKSVVQERTVSDNDIADRSDSTNAQLLGSVPRADTIHLQDHNHSIVSQHSSTLTVILPVTSASIMELDSHLHSLLRSSRLLVEVLLVSPRRYHPQIRKSLRTILSRTDDFDLELSVLQWLDGIGEGEAVIMAAQHATTDWVLLADADGFKHLDATTRDYLLLNNPPRTLFPIGPRGVVLDSSGSTCVVASSLPQLASYLVPPLLLPTSLLPDTLDIKYAREPWIALGKHVSGITPDLSGGTVLGSSDGFSHWCLPQEHEGSPSVSPGPLMDATQLGLDAPQYIFQGGPTPELGSFLVVVYESDLHHIVSVACSNARQGHTVKVVVLRDDDGAMPSATVDLEECLSLVSVHPIPSGQLGGESSQLLPRAVDVLISAVEDDVIALFFAQVHPAAVDSALVDIRIPRDDLPYCDWMAAIELSEWKSEHSPASR